jgi:hypothetical protein
MHVEVLAARRKDNRPAICINYRPGYDIKLPTQRPSTISTPSHHRRNEDGSLRLFRLYENAATEAVSCIYVYILSVGLKGVD